MDRSVGRLAVAAGGAGLAGSYAAVGATGAFLGAPVESLVVAATPGAVVLTTVAVLGDYASLVAFGSALALAALLCAVAVRAALALADGRGPAVAAALAGAFVWAVVAAATGSLRSATGAGVAAGVVVGAAAPSATDAAPGRRRLLRTVGSLAGVVGLSALLGSRERGPSRPADETVAAAVEDRLAAASERELDAGGIDPLVTDIEDFYEVDINSINPTVARDEWTLEVTGSVLETQTLTFDDLADLPVEHRFETLRCVGDEVGGRKMSTALWTGVPVDALLDRAGPVGSHVMLHATDGYYNEFPLEALRGGLLAYRMNGEALPQKHGAPVRALVPGHWGEINVKWITEIEVLDGEEEGYWEKRGWFGTGTVNTVAKLWTQRRLDDGRVRVGGLAYAGVRGVERVEVSTDGGETWTDAELSEPLPDEDVWRQWVHEFEPTRDRHEVVARAVEADGTVQPATESTPQPRGASGWDSTVVER